VLACDSPMAFRSIDAGRGAVPSLSTANTFNNWLLVPICVDWRYDRSRQGRLSNRAYGSDRLPTDDGGHYVAVRFNGPTDTFNHFAQDANFNRGGYRVLENQWAKDIKEGKQVYVAITPTYVGSSKRPSDIDVVFMINGKRNVRSFSNTSKGKSHGK